LDEKEDLLPDLERNEKDFPHDLEDIRKEWVRLEWIRAGAWGAGEGGGSGAADWVELQIGTVDPAMKRGLSPCVFH
jgi:hypothetical protein